MIGPVNVIEKPGAEITAVEIIEIMAAEIITTTEEEADSK